MDGDYTATYDLAGGGVIVEYGGGGGAERLAGLLAAAGHAANADGGGGVPRYDRPGITTRWGQGTLDDGTPAGAVYGVAVADNAQLAAYGMGWTRFVGQPLDGFEQLLARFSYVGDANLDGTVDEADRLLFELAWDSWHEQPEFLPDGSANPQWRRADLTGWMWGDFNHDGVLDETDRALFEAMFDKLHSGALPPLGEPVPEPATLGLLLGGAVLLAGRRRRRGRTAARR